jgi:hypothetical protein
MVMSKPNSDKQDRDETLRAGDIIPLYDNKEDLKPGHQKDKAGDKKDSSGRKKHSLEDSVPQDSNNNLQPPEDSEGRRNENKQREDAVPKFDLAEEIMAEKRKISAAKRKSPDKKSRAQSQQAQLTSYISNLPTPVLSEQEQIIAEIVAKDIDELCGRQVVDAEKRGFSHLDNDTI